MDPTKARAPPKTRWIQDLKTPCTTKPTRPGQFILPATASPPTAAAVIKARQGEQKTTTTNNSGSSLFPVAGELLELGGSASNLSMATLPFKATQGHRKSRWHGPSGRSGDAHRGRADTLERSCSAGIGNTPATESSEETDWLALKLPVTNRGYPFKFNQRSPAPPAQSGLDSPEH